MGKLPEWFQADFDIPSLLWSGAVYFLFKSQISLAGIRAATGSQEKIIMHLNILM